MDGVLGFLASLSFEIIQSDFDFNSSNLQGRYLNYALVDDFPCNIQSAYKRYIPGHAPLTGSHHIFVHEQNIAWLCHSALLYANRELSTPEVTYTLCCRLFRLLLIINDFLNGEKIGGSFDFTRRRDLANNWLRHSQFNRLFGGFEEILAKLARQKIIMCDILPEYFVDVRAKFFAAKGISLQRYFEVLVILMTHFLAGMRPGAHWLAKESVTSNITANCEAIHIVLDAWSINPEKYRAACNAWRCHRKDQGELPLYDYVPLRETPLIEARPKEIISAVPSFVFAKIEDDPFYIFSQSLKGKELTKFHTALGDAYENYANQLVKRIANNDQGGKWVIITDPKTTNDEQLADIYLQRNGTGIMFEHKGQRPGSEFLRGGEGERVVGPPSEILNRLEGGNFVDIKDGSKNDKGLITRGMWQQSKAGQKLIDYAYARIGEKPTRLFPIITLYCPLVVDPVVRKAYLNSLMQAARLYHEEFWMPPQWLNVSDLESLAVMSEDGKLDFEALLVEKTSRFNESRFDFFLYHYKKTRCIDTKLKDESKSLLDSAAVTFFGKHLAEGGTGEAAGLPVDVR